MMGQKDFDPREIEERDKQAQRLDGNYQKGATYGDGRRGNDSYSGGKYNY